jgi:hypothetical protein
MRAAEPRKGAQQCRDVLARLQGTDVQDVRGGETEARLDARTRGGGRQRVEGRPTTGEDDAALIRVRTEQLDEIASGRLRVRDDPMRGRDRAAGEAHHALERARAQLGEAHEREVVYRDDHPCADGAWRRVVRGVKDIAASHLVDGDHSREPDERISHDHGIRGRRQPPHVGGPGGALGADARGPQGGACEGTQAKQHELHVGSQAGHSPHQLFRVHGDAGRLDLQREPIQDHALKPTGAHAQDQDARSP